MGMHFGLVAIKGSAKDLVAIIPEAWPSWEVSSKADGFASAEDIEAWVKQKERFVPAARWTKEDPGVQCVLACEQGPWALLVDRSYTLASDQSALTRLSQIKGTVLSFVVESAGGSAFFWRCESGEIRRSILNTGEDVQSTGSPLPEEAGIDVERYYMAETVSLMKAYGLPSPGELPIPETAIALALTDRTDYSALKAKWAAAAKAKEQAAASPGPVGPASGGRSKPWWKLW